jgi:hypothetical protein
MTQLRPPRADQSGPGQHRAGLAAPGRRRRAAPHPADAACSVPADRPLFVVAFQIGIGGGALVGSLLVDAGELSALCVTGAALAAAGLLVVLAARRAFPPPAPSDPRARPGRTRYALTRILHCL